MDRNLYYDLYSGYLSHYEMGSNTASIANLSAFGNDLTIYRGLERFDVKVKDADAYVMAHFGDEIVSSAVAA